MRDIGKNIKDIRIGKSMTQDDLAEKLFVTRQTVSNYENGRSRPDIDMLMRIADVLNVDIHDILYEPENITDRRKRILTVAVIVIVMAVLGWMVYRLTEYARIDRELKYENALYAVTHFLVCPIYYFTLGYQFMKCMRILQKPTPISKKLQKCILAGCLAAGLHFAVISLPFVVSVLDSNLFDVQIHFPKWWWNIAPFWLDISGSIWFPLLLGLVLGITYYGNRKENN